ncbi:hypothetical protein [uncultured Bacteroides sp.]|uniref:hypothetical protein n=1 Tax=uncultured Bacteroides sp. TaxID=162156 RepID=UPI0026190C0D|nr:hypothetical protein [uncultured Bacteroides sp.]
MEFHQRKNFAYCPKDSMVLQRLVKEHLESVEVYLVCDGASEEAYSDVWHGDETVCS